MEDDEILTDEEKRFLWLSAQPKLDLREKLNLTILFISHDLNLVRYLSDKIAVMNKGEIVEFNETLKLFSDPQDEYTKFLLSCVRSVKL